MDVVSIERERAEVEGQMTASRTSVPPLIGLTLLPEGKTTEGRLLQGGLRQMTKAKRTRTRSIAMSRALTV